MFRQIPTRIFLLCCFGVWFIAAGPRAAAADDEAKAAFEKKYGPAIQKVKSSSSHSDDLDLARSLLAEAESQPPATAALLCRAAHDLSQTSPGGYDQAVEAMELLLEIDPAETEACLEHIFVLRQKQYASASGTSRIEIGREVIEVLLALAERKARRGEKDAAELFLRQAMTIALATRSDRRRIEEQLRILPQATAAGKKREDLQAALQADPRDTATRTELVLLHLVQFDDPAAAQADLAPDLDETLRSYVPLLTRGPESLPPEVAEETAFWLASLARNAPKERRADLLLRARAFLCRVLEALPADDPRRKRAAETFRATERQLASLGAVVGGRAWSLNGAALGLVATPSVNQAVWKARDFLWSVQKPDGAWLPDRPNPMGLDRAGATALVTYALLQSGVSARDERLRRTLGVLRNEETNNTQTLALRCCVWALCRNELGRSYDRSLQRDAETLFRSSGNGGWEATANPASPSRRGDAYYTQWAVLALATAETQGATIPRPFWNQNRIWWSRGQNDDGGWGRRAGRLSRPFYSAAGAVSLLIDLESVGQSRGRALDDRTVKKALAWVDQNFDADEPRDRALFLFTLARLGVARGEASIGQKNWYAWAARELLHTQQRDGAWRPDLESPLATTALNLLTLRFAHGR
ncbi:MAG: terpene cyclase/mutase family protein [Phycisphaerae bacterium]|nr:terpene cyclase/mutase family protein [Phycisphaerae bacterium]